MSHQRPHLEPLQLIEYQKRKKQEEDPLLTSKSAREGEK